MAAQAVAAEAMQAPACKGKGKVRSVYDAVSEDAESGGAIRQSDSQTGGRAAPPTYDVELRGRHILQADGTRIVASGALILQGGQAACWRSLLTSACLASCNASAHCCE